jgi:hypothetical protein
MKCGGAHDARPDSGIRARMTQTSHAPNDLATGGRRRPDGCRLDWFLG